MSNRYFSKHNSNWRIIGQFRRGSIISGGSVANGQTLVEIALILPIFLAIVLSVMEIGRAWSAKQSLTISAREGARILSMPYGESSIYKYKTEEEVINAAIQTVTDTMNGSGTPVDQSTSIEAARIRPGDDAVFNTPDDIQEPYSAGMSPPVIRGDRVGFLIKYKFETPLPIVLKFFDSGGSEQGEINMAVICYMNHE